MAVVQIPEIREFLLRMFHENYLVSQRKIYKMFLESTIHQLIADVFSPHILQEITIVQVAWNHSQLLEIDARKVEMAQYFKLLKYCNNVEIKFYIVKRGL